MPLPICVTSEQFDSIVRCADALSPSDRPQFLQAVAARLAGERELADGVIFRILRDVQFGFPHPTPPKIETGWDYDHPRKLTNLPPIDKEHDGRRRRAKRALPA